MSEAINVVELQSRQKRLENSNKRRKKKIPLTIIGMVFCVLVIVFLFEEKTYHLFGTSTKMVLIVGIISILIIAIYLVLSFLKIRKTNTEIKEISNQLYNILKLNA